MHKHASWRATPAIGYFSGGHDVQMSWSCRPQAGRHVATTIARGPCNGLHSSFEPMHYRPAGLCNASYFRTLSMFERASQIRPHLGASAVTALRYTLPDLHGFGHTARPSQAAADCQCHKQLAYRTSCEHSGSGCAVVHAIVRERLQRPCGKRPAAASSQPALA